VHTQTQQGKPAQSPTAEEIQDLVKTVVAEVAAQTCAAGEQPDILKPFPHGFVPCISLDNAPVHTRAKVALVAQHVPCTFEEIPPYSPDIHKVIEHVHAIVHQAFMARLRRCQVDNLPESMSDVFRIVRHLFKTKITTAGIQEDILSLQATLQAIINRGGQWPEKSLC
jgi:hypothetical protein